MKKIISIMCLSIIIISLSCSIVYADVVVDDSYRGDYHTKQPDNLVSESFILPIVILIGIIIIISMIILYMIVKKNKLNNKNNSTEKEDNKNDN